jgi:general nucleoside transport system ATP-binding protein
MIPRVEVRGLSKSFGAVRALDHVAVTFSPGSLHAVIGENGAGKSTLVKCMMGYHRADAGEIVIDAAPRVIDNPRQAHALGLGLVYQHFTLVPHMTVAENLVLGRGDLPAIIDWKAERRRIDAFQQQMPFALDPDAPVSVLAAGEKQKLEILKQLYLGCCFLMLDEPTSVLTPDEADQVLGTLQRMTKAGMLTVVLITHKIREVLRFADRVTVLRDGRNVGEGEKLGREELERLMFGRAAIPPAARAVEMPGPILLDARELCAVGDRGAPALSGVSFAVRAGEILGIAGVSGNGQRELVEVLAGQRQRETGEVRVAGSPYRATREELRARGVHVLPEEPLRNACVQTMSVSENLAFRIFDVPPNAVAGFVRRRALVRHAEVLIRRYGIRVPGTDAPLETLSGGNVQRVVLARELSEQVLLLIAQNPCFGLDLAATREIRGQIMAARNRGAAVLLISEDLDELLELADRIAVMFEGRLVFETTRTEADVHEIGRHMIGRQEAAWSGSDGDCSIAAVDP